MVAGIRCFAPGGVAHPVRPRQDFDLPAIEDPVLLQLAQDHRHPFTPAGHSQMDRPKIVVVDMVVRMQQPMFGREDVPRHSPPDRVSLRQSEGDRRVHVPDRAGVAWGRYKPPRSPPVTCHCASLASGQGFDLRGVVKDVGADAFAETDLGQLSGLLQLVDLGEAAREEAHRISSRPQSRIDVGGLHRRLAGRWLGRGFASERWPMKRSRWRVVVAPILLLLMMSGRLGSTPPTVSALTIELLVEWFERFATKWRFPRPTRPLQKACLRWL